MENRAEAYEAVNARVKAGELSHVDEARARARVAGLSAERAAPKIEQARIAGEILDKNVPDEMVQVTDKAGKASLRDRLAAAVDEATERGFEFTARPNFPTNANAVVWLNQAKMMLGKLRSDKASYDDIQRFLLDEFAIKSANDGDLLRQTRKEVGEQIKAPGASADVDVAAPAAQASGPANPDALGETDAAASQSDGEADARAAEDFFSDVEDAKASVPGSKRSARLDDGTETGKVRFKSGKGKVVEREVERAKAADKGRTVERDDAAIAAALESLNKARQREEEKRQASEAGRGAASAPQAAAAKETSQARIEAKPEPKESAKAKEVAAKRQAETEKLAEARKAELDKAKETASEKRKREVAEAKAWLAQNEKALKSEPEVTSEGDTDSDLLLKRDAGEATPQSARSTDEQIIQSYAIIERPVGDWLSDFRKEKFIEGYLGDGTLFGKVAGVFGKRADAARKTLSAMFELIAPKIKNVKVYVLPDAAVDMISGDRAAAFYSSKDDYIVLRESAFDAMADNGDAATFLTDMLHEMTHAAFHAQIKSDPVLRGQIDALRLEASKYATKVGLDPSKIYGLENADEFIAETWSNPEFMELLSKVPLSKEMDQSIAAMNKYYLVEGPSQVRTALDWIKAKVAQVFGFKQAAIRFGFKPGKNLFDAAMDMSDILIGMSEASRAQFFADGSQSGQTLESRRDPKPRELRDPVAKKLNEYGADPRDAALAAETIAADPRFAGKTTDAQLQALAARLKDAREVSTAETKRIEAAQKKLAKQLKRQQRAAIAKAEQLEKEVGQELEDTFVPDAKASKVRSLWQASNAQIAYVSERFFGAKNNPVARIAALIEQQRLRREAIFNEHIDIVQKQSDAEKQHTKEQWDEYSNLLIDTTTANVHPDVPLDHKSNKHIQKTGLRDAWKRGQHATLAPRFAALPADLKALYAETRDMYTELQNQQSLQLMKNVLRQLGIADMAVAERLHEGKETQADRDLLGEEVMGHMQNVSELKKIEGPYFNLTRRGNWVVYGEYQLETPKGAKKLDNGRFEFKTEAEAEAFSKATELRNSIQTVYVDGKTGSRFGTDRDGTEVAISKNDVDAEPRYIVAVQTKHVEFFERESEARQRRTDLLEDPSLNLKLNSVEKRKDSGSTPNAELASSQMSALAATVSQRTKDSNLSEAQKNELKAMMNEVSLRFLGSTRIQSTRLPRRYVGGASRDITRNALDYISSSAGYLARLEVSADLNDAMRDMDIRQRDLASRGTDAATNSSVLVEEMRKRAEGGEHMGESFFRRQVNRVLSLSYSYYLGSGAYSAINATQVGLLGLPFLSGQFNPASATFNLTKAYKDVGGLRLVAGGFADTGRALVGKTVSGDRFLKDVKGRLKNPREREMIDTLISQGRIDVEAAHEVERVVKQVGLTSKVVDGSLGYLENVTRGMPQAIEAMNRTVMAVAAYRMHYARNKDHDAAVAFASTAVHDSQGQYSNSNAAPILNNPVGRIALQFMKYPQLVFYMYGKNLRHIVEPLNKGDRRKAVSTLLYLTAAHFAAAGAVGALPYEVLKLPLIMLQGLGLVGFSWEDLEDEFEEYMQELTGDDYLARLITRGAPTAAGIDISSRVGLQNMLTFGEPRSFDETGVWSYLASTAAGAPGGMATNFFKGIRAMADGDYERAAGFMMPIKTLGDAAKAADNYSAGRYDEQDFVMRVFGLMSARQAEISREISSEIRGSRNVRDARTDLERRYRRAQTPAEIARATAAIRAYNSSLDEGARRISIDTLRRYKRNDMQRYQ